MEVKTCNIFYFFYKIIIFIVNKEKDYMRSVYCKFPQLGDRSLLSCWYSGYCTENSIMENLRDFVYYAISCKPSNVTGKMIQTFVNFN